MSTRRVTTPEAIAYVLVIALSIALVFALLGRPAPEPLAEPEPTTSTEPTTTATSAAIPLALHPEWGGWDTQVQECAFHDGISAYAVVRFSDRTQDDLGILDATYTVECYGDPS
ncbi:hypothetical protein [Cellulosimicrobium arenosum]|uniref:Uncharacterized protein n=1 Tax=Cellulosimicrobium arenosum TaxID=2708133 RepID=A0A927G6K5_9MICO|nr:hypothetical protein [Cellulosimicrobium arenosum]MBD8077688.1 hypothetical protein [Cellulosimicrobium arenosum]